MNYFIAYDLGTGGIKASIFTEEGISKYDTFQQYNTYFPQNKYCEQQPIDWWNAVCYTTQKLLHVTGIPNTEIKGVALSGHSLVGVPFDKNGKQLLDSVPIWCDMRASNQLPDFFQNIDYQDWYKITGNGDPPETYTLLKLMWLKNNQPELFRKIHIILGSKDYINYRLTGRFCTDPSYASGFGVFNLKKWDYENNIFEAAKIPREIFPEIIPSDSIVGTVTDDAALLTGLAAGTIVACGAVDNTCMSLGSCGIKEGNIYTSLGSSSWIAVTSREPILDVQARPFVFAHAKKGYYTSAVSIFSAGNSFRWIRDNLCKDCPPDTDAFNIMNRMAESVPAGSNGILFNPSLAGGSSQEPSPLLTGSFLGLTLRNTRADLVRASMEGVAFSLRLALDILLTHVKTSDKMLICGGGSKSALWRKIFADIYNMPILKTNIDQNAASLGAAALAANACEIWSSYEHIPALHKIEDLNYPNPKTASFYEKILPIYSSWTKSIAIFSEQLSELYQEQM